MTKLSEIRAEIDRVSDRRAELWHVLSTGHDAQISADVKDLDQRLERLWDEHRAVKAQLRFGDRDEIIKRARHEERLARAA
jgi:galactokinase/mevalonate kinase-like predicted kinase